MFPHLKHRILEECQASIVYLGGSITEGQGVQDKRLCWQGLFQSWLEQKYPQCDFTSVNGGIGGTDSFFGAFRMEQDVLKAVPDLLVVEFAVNDYTRPGEKIRESLEAILFKLWRSCPLAEVLFVLTSTIKMAEENYDLGKVPESVLIHQMTAEEYGIPCLNIGIELIRMIRDSGMNPDRMLPDRVHPGKEGYRTYFKILKGMFEELFEAEREKETGADENNCRDGEYPPAELISCCRGNTLCCCEMVPARQAQLRGFVIEHVKMCGRYGNFVSSYTQGHSLDFSFHGDKIGLFYMVACDGGNLEWSVDHGEWQQLSCFDGYARQFDRGGARMLAENLTFGPHELSIRVLGTKHPDSAGFFVRISSFLI